VADAQRHPGAVGQEQVAIGIGLPHVHVGAADAARTDADEDLVGLGHLRCRSFGDLPGRVTPDLAADDRAALIALAERERIALARRPFRLDDQCLHDGGMTGLRTMMASRARP